MKVIENDANKMCKQWPEKYNGIAYGKQTNKKKIIQFRLSAIAMFNMRNICLPFY